MNKNFSGFSPEIDSESYIADSAVVEGKVKIKSGVSVWPASVIRGDIEKIVVGRNTNIQDATVIHTSPNYPVLIDENVTVGHGAILHGCKIENNVLIGMGSTLLDGSVIRSNVIVAAGSLVPEGKILEPGWLYMGSPVFKKRELKQSEKDMIAERAVEYVKLAGLS